MKSGGPWNLRGLRPEILAAAHDAARRSGISVGEWLNDLIEQSNDYSRASLRPGDDSGTEDYVWPEESGRDDYRRRGRPRPPQRDYEYDDDRAAGRESVLAREQLGEVHARLDRLTNQLEQLVRDKAPLRGAPMRPSHHPSYQPWLGDGDLGADADSVSIADEAASAATHQQPDLPSPQTAPQLAGEAGEPQQPPQFLELEEQLRQITAQLESLRSTGLDQVIAAFHSDLAEIRQQLTEALPRKAIEALCIEVEALAQRIVRSRERTGDSDAIAGIERGLAEVRDALRAMTPAEHLIGFDEALKALAQKLDLIIARDDPAALRQLETALGALRGIVSHVASNDALNKVAEDVSILAAKIDSLAKGAASAASGQAVSALGNRIDTLTDAINASAEVAAPRGLEKLLSDIMEKLESVRLTTDPAAFKRLEERIGQLIGRFDASDARLGNMAAVERGVTDLLAHMEELRGADAAAAGTSARPAVAAIARDVAEIKRSEQRTQESLEAVHGTVEQVVGRLAMIESDIHDAALRAPRSQTPVQPAGEKAEPAAAMPSQAGAPTAPAEPAAAMLSQVSAPTAPAELIAAAERQDFIAAARRATQAATASASDDEMRLSSRRRRRSRSGASGEMQANNPLRLRKLLVAAAIVVVTVGCLQIALHIFQDSRPAGGEVAPWQRPAAPSAQPGNNTAPPRSGALQPGGSATPPPAATAGPMPLATEAPAAPDASAVGRPSATQNSEPAAAAEPKVAPNPPPIVVPSPPTNPLPNAAPPATAAPAPAAPQPGSPNPAEPTGTLPPRAMPLAAVAPPPPSSSGVAINAPDLSIDVLPPAIGGPGLRAAAIAGDRSAQYEIALRFGEGRGVPRNERQAAYWLELAAKQGLAPAQFRLGGYYEKGIGVKKDLAAARDLYLAAAAKGNGKAMHNLAVLYADGVNGRADYHTAALWFRKAADRGVTDSQYNLAILYARGSGEPQNYAEAYKWFALAAKAGDVEAANKRDETAAQLDEETLIAANLVVRNWKPEPQPDEAIKVKTPPGGWDAAIQQPKPKSRTKSANLAGPDSKAD
jgi:localization factor PodJL